jgi:putative transcriptional regulator
VAGDSSKTNPPTQLGGKLLLADPSLRDSIFHKSVILIHDHSREEGAMGLILNHPTGHQVGDFLKTPEFNALAKLPVYKGGPVDPHQMTFSSFWWQKKSGLSWAIRLSAEEASAHARRPGHIVRAFVGYSGWSPGQLENELRQTAWIPIAPKSALLGQAHDPQLWTQLLSSISPLHHLLSLSPRDPMLN